MDHMEKNKNQNEEDAKIRTAQKPNRTQNPKLTNRTNKKIKKQNENRAEWCNNQMEQKIAPRFNIGVR